MKKTWVRLSAEYTEEQNTASVMIKKKIASEKHHETFVCDANRTNGTIKNLVKLRVCELKIILGNFCFNDALI